MIPPETNSSLSPVAQPAAKILPVSETIGELCDKCSLPFSPGNQALRKGDELFHVACLPEEEKVAKAQEPEIITEKAPPPPAPKNSNVDDIPPALRTYATSLLSQLMIGVQARQEILKCTAFFVKLSMFAQDPKANAELFDPPKETAAETLSVDHPPFDAPELG